MKKIILVALMTLVIAGLSVNRTSAATEDIKLVPKEDFMPRMAVDPGTKPGG